MRRAGAIVGSALFLVAAPGFVAGWVPWALTRWAPQPPLFGLEVSRWVGVAFAGVAAALLLDCFARFAWHGRGTPFPGAPTEELVVSGGYRHVRNPMYVAVVAAIVGQALWLGSAVLLGYATAVGLGFQTFVLAYEEPTLRRRYGASYERYCRHVGRWWPRLRPWRA